MKLELSELPMDKKPPAPTKLHRVPKNEVVEMKQALIEALLSPTALGKLRQREVVKMLLPEIKALRNTGVEFDDIAKVLQKKGMKLSGETLRLYYFQEKGSADESDAAATAEQYKRMAERVLEQVAHVSGRSVQATLDRVLAGVKQMTQGQAPGQNNSAPPSAAKSEGASATGGEQASQPPPKTGGKFRQRSAAGATDGTSRAGGKVNTERPAIGDGNPALSLQDVEKMLGEQVDLSRIPRRDPADGP